jgi:hypothetical protein
MAALGLQNCKKCNSIHPERYQKNNKGIILLITIESTKEFDMKLPAAIDNLSSMAKVFGTDPRFHFV